MMAYTSRELVAAEGYYHKSCYKVYTKQAPNTQGSIASADLEYTMEMEVNDEDDSIYCRILSESYDELFEYILSEIVSKLQVLRCLSL